MGVGVGKYKISPQSSKIDRRKEKKNDIFSGVDTYYILYNKYIIIWVPVSLTSKVSCRRIKNLGLNVSLLSSHKGLGFKSQSLVVE